jgi:hypothetical protein
VGEMPSQMLLGCGAACWTELRRLSNRQKLDTI